jgi:hypothetical protein
MIFVTCARFYLSHKQLFKGPRLRFFFSPLNLHCSGYFNDSIVFASDKPCIIFYLSITFAKHGLPETISNFIRPDFVWNNLERPPETTNGPPIPLAGRAALFAHFYATNGVREIDIASYFRSNWDDGPMLFLVDHSGLRSSALRWTCNCVGASPEDCLLPWMSVPPVR